LARKKEYKRSSHELSETAPQSISIKSGTANGIRKTVPNTKVTDTTFIIEVSSIRGLAKTVKRLQQNAVARIITSPIRVSEERLIPFAESLRTSIIPRKETNTPTKIIGFTFSIFNPILKSETNNGTVEYINEVLLAVVWCIP
jgi:hypothetical protein